MITAAQLATDLEGSDLAHRRLLGDVDGLTDVQARQPSLLEGWSVGHVLNHLRRNADGFATMARAAADDEVGDQYASQRAREAGIEDGADAPADQLVERLRHSIEALAEAFDALTPEQWATGRGRTLRGEILINELPWRRWREVEVHHADLALGYSVDDWPDSFVRRELPGFVSIWQSRRPMGLTDLPPEVLALTPQRRLAWMFGRLQVDGIAPADVYS